MKHSKTVIALLSLSLIALELIWTRIFSAEFFYTFGHISTYVNFIVQIAPLGFFMGMPFPRGTEKVGELVD